MKLITKSIAMIALLASPYSYAALITHGYLTTDDTTNYITDTVTNRMYSRFDAFNLSYADTKAAIAAGSGHSFEGWSIATASVAYDFYAAALGVSTVQCIIIPTDPASYCGNIAEYVEGDFGASADAESDAFAYLTDAVINPISVGLFDYDSGTDHYEVRDWDSWGTIAMLDEFGGSSYPLIPLNLLLYKDVVVPVPAAVWLFGSGLISLIGIARRRKV